MPTVDEIKYEIDSKRRYMLELRSRYKQLRLELEKDHELYSERFRFTVTDLNKKDFLDNKIKLESKEIECNRIEDEISKIVSEMNSLKSQLGNLIGKEY
jgi:hypothetical protein